VKPLIKLTSLALCLVIAATVFTACKSKVSAVSLEHVDVYVLTAGTRSDKLTDVGTNKVTYTDGTLRVDVAASVSEVEFDLASFFAANPKYAGKKFYFTRDDVKKGDGTLVKGYAWAQVGTEGGNRVYKKMGYETNESIKAKTKEEITALINREGEARMYALTAEPGAGRSLVYLCPTLDSSVEPGETRVTFYFRGHHGKTAVLKVLVNKA